MTVTATLVGDSTLTSDTTVAISLGGSAGASDYGASRLASVTIPAGDASGSDTLKVTPTERCGGGGRRDDRGVGFGHRVLGRGGDYHVWTDDDTAEVSISGPSANVAEGNNAATYTVTLSKAVAKQVRVAWSATAGHRSGG